MQEFGLGAYNQILKSNDSLLYDKKQESEKAAVDLNDSTKTEEEKQSIRERKEELDEEIAKMEARRNRMKNYTENIESSSDVGKYLDKKNQAERDKKIEQEVDRRIQKRTELGLKVDEKEKKQIELEVKKQMNRQVKKRSIYRDEKTGQKEIISSVGMQFKRDMNRAIWGNDSIKSATKNMVKGSTNKIMGNAMIFAAIPLTVANPKVGLALLGKGLHSSKSSNEFKKVATFGERRRLRKSKKITLEKEKNKKYTFGRFSKPALKSIQAKQRMKEEANVIRKINTPSVSMKAFSLPLRMLGVNGAVRSAMAYQYKVDKAKRKYYQNEEASYAVATKDSVNKDFIRTYDNLVYSMEKKYENMTFEEAILDNKKAIGQVYEVNDKTFEFKPKKKRSISAITDVDLIDNAILNVAIKNDIIDLNKVDFENKEIQTNVIEELSGLGILTNSHILDVDNPTQELSLMFKKLETRKKVLVKKSPELAKERLVQIVTAEYMKDNNIESAEEVKKDEHTQKIKEIVFERISKKPEETRIEENIFTTKPLETEEKESIFDQKIEDIVRSVIETTDNEDERISLIADEVSKVIFEEKEAPKAESVDELLEKLILRKQEITTPYTISEEKMPKIKDELYDIQPLDTIKEKQEDIVVKEKTEEFMKTFDINEVISTIKKKDKEKVETENFIENIISSVEEVKDTPTLTKEEEKVKNSPEEVKEFIRNVAKKKVKTSKEFIDLNEELRKFDSRKTIDEMTDEYIEENSSGKHDELISNLIASMQEDKVLVDIKVTKPTDKRVLTMKYIDEQREINTYNKTNIDEILKSMESKKTTNNEERIIKNG